MKKNELANDFINLNEESQNNKLTDEYIFKKICEFDKKYNNDKNYFACIEGLISNIGSDQKSINILNYAIKRLKEKKDKLIENKYYYDLANTIHAKGSILYPNSTINELIHAPEFAESRKYYYKINSKDIEHYSRAITNSANLLEKHGRNFEAIYLYDKVLRINPSFGMALGNKAKALFYYYRLSPYKSLKILLSAKKLLLDAIDDPKIIEVGGKSIISIFQSELNNINYIIENGNFKRTKNIIKPKLSNYNNFILKYNLFLNYDFGIYYDKYSLMDVFFPEFIEKIHDKKSEKSTTMSEKIYYCFQIFNQLLEDYVSARYIFYLSYSKKFNDFDKNVRYIYTLDYTKHSTKYGLLKNIYANLFNCLDKIAHIILYYFDIKAPNQDNIDIYFDSLLCEEFKNIIIEKNNYQLLAIYNLVNDFKQNYPYFHYKRLRNKITHSFLNINVGISYDEKYNNFEILEDDLENYVIEMFHIIKASIMYFILFLMHSKDDKLMISMEAIFQNYIYK